MKDRRAPDIRQEALHLLGDHDRGMIWLGFSSRGTIRPDVQVSDSDAYLYSSQLPELELLEMVERMGNPSKDEGEWIAKIDLVESGKILKLEEQEDLGKCGSECRTIQKAAEEILEEHDTDIAEKLWQVKRCPPSRLKGITKAPSCHSHSIMALAVDLLCSHARQLRCSLAFVESTLIREQSDTSHLAGAPAGQAEQGSIHQLALL